MFVHKNVFIWASIKCRFPDILIWISEAVFESLIISHNCGKCLSESQTKNQKKKKKTKPKKNPLIPALRSQRQADFWVQGQPGLQSEFQDSQGYTEKPCLEKQQQQQKTNKQKHFLRFIVVFINMLYPKIKQYNLSSSLSPQLNSALYQIFCSILLPQFNLCHP